jgi:dolichol kinase
MSDRIRQHASHPTSRRRGLDRLTWRGVLAGFLLAAAVPVAVLVVSYPVPTAAAVVGTAATAVAVRTLARRVAPSDERRRTAPTRVVDGD